MKPRNRDLVYKSECYRIIGLCYKVYNFLGFGLREKNYQKALEEILRQEKINFKSQFYVSLEIDGKKIGKYYLDLLIDEKIALELKIGDHFLKKEIDQLFSYIKSAELKLGILVNFTSNGVKYKRIVNL